MRGKVALGTDVAIKFLDKDENIVNFLLRHTEIYLPVIVAGELIFGALNSRQPEQNLVGHKKLIQRTNTISDKRNYSNYLCKKPVLALKGKENLSLKMICGLHRYALNINCLC